MNGAELERKLRLERAAEVCVHFNGIGNDACKVGVAYASVPRPLPCLLPFRPGLFRAKCDKFEAMGLERVMNRARDDAEYSARCDRARAAIIADARGQRGVQGKLRCPICEVGDLRWSIEGCNGHVHAVCSTLECVRWRE